MLRDNLGKIGAVAILLAWLLALQALVVQFGGS